MRILFQGDSITDAGRTVDNDENNVGVGYPLLVKSALGLEFPGKHEFINRGISGNRIIDIYARLKSDIINLKPDVMSILVGVNDVWHDLRENPNGISADKYYKIYDMLIAEVKEALPGIKIMIMEPFLLRGCDTLDTWDVFSKEVKERAKMAKKIAEKYNLFYIPLQDGFNEMLEEAEESYWVRDGVHPTSMGHEFIKNEWIKAFNKL